VFLTEANLLHYLLEKRFADLETIVHGAYAVRALTRRNRNFRVTCGARSYLVKQVRKWDADGQESLAREAAIYWLCKTDSRFAPLAALIPESYAWDPSHSILILEFLPEYTELYDLPDRFAPELARLAGGAMGSFHREMSGEEMGALVAGEAPSYLSLHEAEDDEMASHGLGRLELVRLVKKHPEFGTALDRLRDEWREDTLVHGDWKIENCLVSDDREQIRVIDWELAGYGDACWDVATMLQSYWSFWVRWPSSYTMEEIRPAVGWFLDAYAEARGCAASEVSSRAIRFMGARMLQTAFEALDGRDAMTADAVRLAQASLNILTRAEWAEEQLLGTRSKCFAS
jgi:phosphotransferase family enzyme